MEKKYESKSNVTKNTQQSFKKTKDNSYQLRKRSYNNIKNIKGKSTLNPSLNFRKKKSRTNKKNK